MDDSRQDYPAMLATLSPAQAMAVLNDRMKHVGKLNSDLADWLQERRRIEEAYATGLRKLARKSPPDESSELGVFTTPWQKIISSTEALAESHGSLAQKIEVDGEQPLRSFVSSNREVQAMSNITGNLNAILDQIDSAQQQSDKLKQKGAKASTKKVAQAAQELDSAQQQWDSQAPFVFEKLQEVDETRINHVRDVLTQFETLEADAAERNRATTESALNSLLNVQTEDEIRTFTIRITTEKPKLPSKPSRPPTSSTLAPPPIPGQDDAASQQSGSTQDHKEIKESKPSRFGGLKRLGTVVGRRRQSFHPYGRAGSPERKSATNLGILGSLGGKGKSKEKSHTAPVEPQAIPSPPRRISEAASNDERRTSEAHSSTKVSRRMSVPNGTTLGGSSSIGALNPPVNGATGHDLSILQEPLEPVKSPPPVVESPQQFNAPPLPAKDAEGYSVPPANNDPISQAEQEAMAESSGPQFKVDIRNAPIQEEGDAETALANVANTLRAQASLPSRKTGTVRGRRDVRNTIFIPNPEPPTLAQSAEPAVPSSSSVPTLGAVPETAQASAPVSFPPPAPPASPPAASAAPPAPPHSPYKPGRHLSIDDNHGGSDTQSIRSGRSLSSSTSTVVKHPEMHEAGLNASFVETVSAWFDKGAVTKAVVIGEVAMVFNPPDMNHPFGSETVRLENFPVLEKVAPNPTFIEQLPDKAGCYTLNLASITKTSVAFKYQVHLDDSNVASHAPLLVNVAWKPEALQTSAILSYTLNPLYSLGGKSKVTLRNAVVVLHLDGKASSCQSKPVGTFSREKSMIYWRLGDVTIEPDQPAQQLRARFFTETEAKPGHSEARWEISGDDAVGLGSGLAIVELKHAGEGLAADGADPFADDDAPAPGEEWKPIPTAKKIVSGTYHAL